MEFSWRVLFFFIRLSLVDFDLIVIGLDSGVLN
jgi:hypothetical protein